MSILATLFLLAPQELVETDARCMSCHERQADAWKTSVHGDQSVGCVGCHGSDKIDVWKIVPHLFTDSFLRGSKRLKTIIEDGEEAEAVVADSIMMCAKCHDGVVTQFKKSKAHYDEVMDPDSRKWQGCQNCHPYHTMQRADFMVIIDRKPHGCFRCHKKTSENYKLGRPFAEASKRLKEACGQLEGRINNPIPGISQFLEQIALEGAQAKLRELRTKQHSQEFEALTKQAGPAAEKADTAYNKLTKKDEGVPSRKWGLFLFLGLLGVSTVLARSWLKGRAAS